ncbi:MAG: PilZ domain-containing protein [Gammaproteobacteria bacterium]|nr:PilZ domain-containing protein [Gammaproteobacteria bacterium]
MPVNQEHRHFTRIPFDAEVHLSNPDNTQVWHCQLIDISLNGVLTSQPDNWSGRMGEHYKLELQLGNKSEEGLRLHMNVNVAHSENNHIGFQCLQMDVDTATHLHRLVELNLGDAKILERELTELIKQH